MHPTDCYTDYIQTIHPNFTVSHHSELKGMAVSRQPNMLQQICPSEKPQALFKNQISFHDVSHGRTLFAGAVNSKKKKGKKMVILLYITGLYKARPKCHVCINSLTLSCFISQVLVNNRTSFHLQQLNLSCYPCFNTFPCKNNKNRTYSRSPCGLLFFQSIS